MRALFLVEGEVVIKVASMIKPREIPHRMSVYSASSAPGSLRLYHS